MWALLWHGLRIAATASVGYFINDIGDAVTRYFPGTTDQKTGKIAWYWVVLIFVAVGSAVALLLFVVIPKKYQKTK